MILHNTSVVEGMASSTQDEDASYWFDFFDSPGNGHWKVVPSPDRPRTGLVIADTMRETFGFTWAFPHACERVWDGWPVMLLEFVRTDGK